MGVVTFIYKHFSMFLSMFSLSCPVCDPVMGDEGKLYVPPELVSVYREKASNLLGSLWVCMHLFR